MRYLKQFYTTPVVDLFEVSEEENFMSPGSGYNNDGNAGNDMSEDNEYSYQF